MSVRMLATILKAMIAAVAIGGGLFVVLMLSDRMTEDVFLMYLVSFLVVFFLWDMVFIRLPVRCDRRGCQGRMRHKWVKEAALVFRLHYVCDVCGDVYDTKIFLTHDSGDAW